MAAPHPAPAHGQNLLRNAGTCERGVSTLSALVILLPSQFAAARLNEVASPFVSDGEILVLGELALRQRVNPEPMRGNGRWPVELNPALALLFDAAAKALAEAGLFIFHRTIFSALQLAHENAQRRGAIP